MIDLSFYIASFRLSSRIGESLKAYAEKSASHFCFVSKQSKLTMAQYEIKHNY